MSVWASRRLRR